MRCSLARQSRVLLIASLAFVGCGDGGPNVELGTVTGVVTDKNGPVAGAAVEFYPDKGSPSFATTDSNGRYELRYSAEEDGAVVGPHSITVTVQMPGAAAAGGGEEVLETPTKTLALQGKRDVVAGENTMDLDLKDATPIAGGSSRPQREVLEPSAGR